MNFLALAQRYTFEVGDSGETGDLPTTVVSQTGKLLRAVRNVQQAWEDIQNSKRSWRWMLDEAIGEESVTAGSSTVTLVGDNTDFDEIRPYDPNGKPHILCYQDSIGVTDVQPIYLIPWAEFHGFYDAGNFSGPGRPNVCAVGPGNVLSFHPPANVVYRLKYQYKKTLQTLAVDADIPAMPTKHHMLIVWVAVAHYGRSTESNRIQGWAGNGIMDPRTPFSPINIMYKKLCQEQLAPMSYFGEL